MGTSFAQKASFKVEPLNLNFFLTLSNIRFIRIDKGPSTGGTILKRVKSSFDKKMGRGSPINIFTHSKIMCFLEKK